MYLLIPIVLKKLGGPITDVSEALDNDCLAGNIAVETSQLLDFGVLQELTDTEVDTETSRFVASTDTTLRDGLSCDASCSIYVLWVELTIGVHDPGHFPWAGSNVRRRHIDSWSDKVLLAQFHGISTGDALQLCRCKFLGVELDASFGATKGYIDDGTLEGHQSGQSLDLLQIDLVRETDAAFGWKAVARVLGTVTFDNDVRVSIDLNWELDA